MPWQCLTNSKIKIRNFKLNTVVISQHLRTRAVIVSSVRRKCARSFCAAPKHFLTNQTFDSICLSDFFGKIIIQTSRFKQFRRILSESGAAFACLINRCRFFLRKNVFDKVNLLNIIKIFTGEIYFEIF